MTDWVARARRDTVGDAIRRAARVHRDREALVFERRSWSFAALDAGADRMATHLLGLGLRPGERVAAFGRNSDAYLLLWLGCARAGLVHVPINYALTGPELAYIVAQSGARALFAAPALEAVRDKVDILRRLDPEEPGVLVASREVEDVLFTHPAVSEVAVVGLPDPKWIEAVTAFVVLRAGQAVDKDALIAHAATRLAPFKLPKRVVFIDHLPRNTAGKLLKRELRRRYAPETGETA